ncbi:AbrB/MazE/SpoVT family DNA-binding domain-containing protein [Schinkia azotoformans]|uniref:Uncharacterized protein n=1 Tax=Schinkia azotoformans LMG 9581 TaxID=1131731 RepID=K6BV51_SCHAZ|nr:AbrB/MazE/SpoVT family DNA-binding domain-containing protein [Schinkia azotoformans]EKN62805.1 hypothetical protein BAZO_20348 [Schinkia azotoformans LMG 9581]MEC1639180.1 AbrB/MazE/SpoVT family DNA-binding domain-containing protein [Schinkia azotoformans]MEC1945768.1 AbrB/MazE/SpoVT family DNA-binding domain-containing protein [Schinkia azotoformans]
MEKITQVQKRNLISLATIGAELGIKEGDYVSIEVKDGGLFLRPVNWHDKSQEYFWTNSFQKKMKQAEKDLEEGNYQKFDSLSELADFIEKGIEAKSE